MSSQVKSSQVKSSQVKSSQVKSKILAAVLGLGLISSAAQAQVAPTLDWQVYAAGAGRTLLDPNVVFSGNGVAHAPTAPLGYTDYELPLPSSIHIDANAFLMEARIKNPAAEGGAPAYDVYVGGWGRTPETNAIVAMMDGAWAAGYAGAQAGTTSFSGASTLVQDLQNWHTFGVQTQNGTMSIFYDGATIASFAYQSQVGEIGQLHIGLKGTGTIDWVNVSSNGNLVLQSDMNSPTVTVTAVPEPETYAMLLAGLGVLGAASRRKPKQSAVA